MDQLAQSPLPPGTQFRPMEMPSAHVLQDMLSMLRGSRGRGQATVTQDRNGLIVDVPEDNGGYLVTAKDGTTITVGEGAYAVDGWVSHYNEPAVDVELPTDVGYYIIYRRYWFWESADGTRKQTSVPGAGFERMGEAVAVWEVFGPSSGGNFNPPDDVSNGRDFLVFPLAHVTVTKTGETARIGEIRQLHSGILRAYELTRYVTIGAGLAQVVGRLHR